MLHKETVDAKTLELLIALQREPELEDFNLVGGTALALHIGHRKSIDLDFFTISDFDLEQLKSMLIEKYGFTVSFERKHTLKGFINNVKIDCIRYNYPYISDLMSIDGVRLVGIPDIIAMKLSAIAQDGTRIKDFIDIAYLSDKYTFNEMLGLYKAKFPSANILMPAKAITYFDEIDFNESIIMIIDKFNWKKVAKRLNDMVKFPNKKFQKL